MATFLKPCCAPRNTFSPDTTNHQPQSPMDNINPPPPILPGSMSTPPLPPDDTPETHVPVTGFLGAVETILRQPRRVIHQLSQGSASLTAALLTVAILCAAFYGLVVGSFSMGTQLWAAPTKIVLGMLICGFICLPSLYIFSCLSGSEARLGTVFGLLAGLLALMTVLLIGFAPVAWVFSQSTTSRAMMGGLHLLFWVVATAFGIKFLRNGMEHLNVRSSGGLRIWTIIFVLVMVQMTTALRPLIGDAKDFLPTEKKFFLSHWLDSIKEESLQKKAETAEAAAAPGQQ